MGFGRIFAALIILMSAGTAYAGKSDPGSGGFGFTIIGGYNAGYLAYKETDLSGVTCDRDYGYLNGLSAEARFESRLIWTRITADYFWTNYAKYDGALQDGTPDKTLSKERIYLYEGDIGYKLLNVQTSTLTPYAGIGFRRWRRWAGGQQDALPSYIEKYTWYFAAIGFNYAWKIDRLTAGLDTAAHIPFSMQMTTNEAGAFDETVFKIKSRVGFEARLPFTYDIYNKFLRSGRVFLSLTPYYQYWGIGASDPVTMTRNGVPVAPPDSLQYEPDSRTDIYGASIGIGVNF